MARAAGMPPWDSRKPPFAYGGKWPSPALHQGARQLPPGSRRCVERSGLQFLPPNLKGSNLQRPHRAAAAPEAVTDQRRICGDASDLLSTS